MLGRAVSGGSRELGLRNGNGIRNTAQVPHTIKGTLHLYLVPDCVRSNLRGSKFDTEDLMVITFI